MEGKKQYNISPGNHAGGVMLAVQGKHVGVTRCFNFLIFSRWIFDVKRGWWTRFDQSWQIRGLWMLIHPDRTQDTWEKGKGMIHNLTCICVTHSSYVVEWIAVGNSFLKHDNVGMSSASMNEHGALLMLIILFIYTLRGRLSGCRIWTERLACQWG